MFKRKYTKGGEIVPTQKTHKEYVKEVKNLYPDIEVVGTYVNAKTQILHKCLLHNVEWMSRPDNILQGKGCPKCGDERRIKGNTMSHEEYVKRLSIQNPTVEVIGKYVTAKTKILHHCLIHDVYWEASPDSVSNKQSGCHLCKKERFHIATTKTRDQYIKEIATKNPTIELIGYYLGNKTKTKHYCKIHDYYFDSMPDTILSGSGCKYCKSDKLRELHLRTEEDYVKELENKGIKVKLIGKYTESLIPTKHLCLVHNVVWNTTPARVLNGCGCHKCGSEKIRDHLLKSRDEYIDLLSIRNPDIELVGEYLGYKVPTKHRCKEHGEIFYTTPTSAIKGCGCLHCSGSKGERYIGRWLKKENITYETQKSFDGCKDKNPLLFDFYLPDYNCCIEYDGLQHFKPIDYFGGQKSLEYTQRHDKMKTDYCKDNNIKLLRIPYFKNIETELNNFLFI